PCLRHALVHRQTVETCVTQLNERLTKLAKAVLERKSDRNIPQRDVSLLFSLLQAGGHKDISREQASALFFHCLDLANLVQPAPFEALKLVEASPPPSFPIGTRDLVNHGAPIRGRVTIKPISDQEAQPEGAEWILIMRDDGKEGDEKEPGKAPESLPVRLTSSDPANWVGFTLSKPGTYRISTDLVGGAQAGQGSTRDQSMTANIRFTSGKDLLLPGYPSVSSAGMEQVSMRGKWQTRPLEDRSLDLGLNQSAIVLELTDSKCIIRQHGREYYSLPLAAPPLLVA